MCTTHHPSGFFRELLGAHEWFVMSQEKIIFMPTPCQTEVNSKVSIDLNTPDLYFSFLFWSLNSFYCGDHITDSKCKLAETNILQFHITFSTGNKYVVLHFFQVLNITWFYGNCFTEVVVLNTLLHISVCVYIHIYLSICEQQTETKLCTNPLLLHFLICNWWAIQSVLYSEWLSPTDFPKIIPFLEKNGEVGKTSGQTVERIAGR